MTRASTTPERPSLARHETRLALLEQSRAHDADHDEAVLEAIRDLGRKLDEHRQHVDAKFVEVEGKHTALSTVVSETKAMVRGFSAGWAAAFMFIGSLVTLGITNLKGLFQ